ncbi:substrate-binding domain-containing protein [Amphibiibacter pelophylacis]|uniref:LacI family DNA-binding transcriptional regulator n=1 Tax=Amphibiibacter pelophylacis TaxID=1799477 RepID=A0ACC6P373_9BURK
MSFPQRPPRLTIDDIAREAQVSRATASMVLNGHASKYRISAATAERVQAVADRLHFVPNAPARHLRQQRTDAVGLVVPDLRNSAHAYLAQAVERACRERGLQVLLVTSNEDAVQEEAALHHLMSRQVDGLIVVPSQSEPGRYQPWARRLPMVFVDRHIPGSGIAAVVSDAASSVCAAVGAVMDGGERDILFLGGRPSLSVSRDRRQGFEDALHERGLTLIEGENGQFGEFSVACGEQMMAAWVQRHGRWPGAVFTASIALLEGVLACARAHEARGQTVGLRRLITFDDHSLLDSLSLPVDSILQDTPGLAAQALALLLDTEALQRAPLQHVPSRLRRRGGAGVADAAVAA